LLSSSDTTTNPEQSIADGTPSGQSVDSPIGSAI